MPYTTGTIRKMEMAAGLMMILSVLSILVAFLLKFEYTVPNATFDEDVAFLIDNVMGQRTSAIAWIITGTVNLFFLPFYLILFQRFQKGMHFLSSFFILAMAFIFFILGINEWHLASLTELDGDTDIILNGSVTTGILISIRNILILIKLGLTAFGAFTTVFTISRFSEVKFPVIGSTLAFLAGPVIITFTWLNPAHILMTSSLAAACTGLLIIGAHLVIKGLVLKNV
ncbi:MAG: hypothetical protein WD052_10585 [Bacteroidales bacterium]